MQLQLGRISSLSESQVPTTVTGSYIQQSCEGCVFPSLNVLFILMVICKFYIILLQGDRKALFGRRNPCLYCFLTYILSLWWCSSPALSLLSLALSFSPCFGNLLTAIISYVIQKGNYFNEGWFLMPDLHSKICSKGKILNRGSNYHVYFRKGNTEGKGQQLTWRKNDNAENLPNAHHQSLAYCVSI